MSDSQFELTRDQKEMLLRGLRFVRSSVALETCDYTDEIAEKRESDYEQISRLEAMLNGVPLAETATV